MAYALRYTITARGVDNNLYTAEIYDESGDAAETIDQGKFPFQHSLLASSDDPLQPVLASSLGLVLNITDFDGTLPDLVAANDKEYFVKFKQGTNLLWQGWVINNGSNIPFKTGYVGLEMQCTDGLGLLKDIDYEPAIKDINEQEAISTIINRCFLELDYIDSFNVNFCFNIYGVGMDTNQSPLAQMYLSNRFTDGKDCYTVLSEIAQSLQCRILQRDGNWWFESIYERAADEQRTFAVTLPAGTWAGPTNVTNIAGVGAYPALRHFVDGTQMKIMRKGFANLKMQRNLSVGANMINNADLSAKTAGFPDFWSKVEVGAGSVGASDNKFTLTVGTSGTNAARAICNSVWSASYYAGTDQVNKVSVSFVIRQDVTNDTHFACMLFLKLYDPVLGHNWSLYQDNDKKSWFYNSLTSPYAAYYVDYEPGDRPIGSQFDRTVTISDIDIPVAGIMGFEIWLQSGNFGGYSKTQEAAIISDFKVTFSPAVVSQTWSAQTTNGKYTKEIGLPISCGTNFLDNVPEYNGTILKAKASRTDIDVPWQNFYDFETGDPLDPQTFIALLRERASRIVFPAQVNIDAIVSSFMNVGAKVSFSDPTTRYPISGKAYICGAVNTNYCDNTIQGTWLQINDSEISGVTTSIDTKYG